MTSMYAYADNQLRRILCTNNGERQIFKVKKLVGSSV